MMKMFDVYPVYPLQIEKGVGAWIWDKDGQQYLDFYGGHAVISVGHAHPHFTSAVQNQLAKLPFYSNSIVNPLQDQLAALLGEQSGLTNYNLFLISSGAEANENALKLASYKNGRTKVVSFKGGFHGRTSAAANVTDSKTITAPINRGFENIQLALGDRQGLENILASGKVSSVIIEGIQGIGGINTIDVSFFDFLRYQCDQTDTILILDEVQSGYGRSGHFFAYQKNKQIKPDIISMGKGMGNGFPLGGILISPIFEAKYGLLGTTYGGNHLACAAGIAVLEIMKQENLVEHSAHIGKYLMDALRQELPFVEVRGEGLMIGLEFSAPINELRRKLLFEEHLFVGSSSNPNVMRLLPPLCIGKQEADTAIERIVTCANVSMMG